VRRIGRDAQNRLHAGVEMLSSQVEGVVLREGNHSGMNEEQPALWVKRIDIDAGEAWLLMKLDTFSVNRSLLMRAAGPRHRRHRGPGLVPRAPDHGRRPLDHAPWSLPITPLPVAGVSAMIEAATLYRGGAGSRCPRHGSRPRRATSRCAI
jgi:hypothetical protein